MVDESCTVENFHNGSELTSELKNRQVGRRAFQGDIAAIVIAEPARTEQTFKSFSSPRFFLQRSYRNRTRGLRWVPLRR